MYRSSAEIKPTISIKPLVIKCIYLEAVKRIACVQINHAFRTEHQASEAILASQFWLRCVAKPTRSCHVSFTTTVQVDKLVQISISVIIAPLSKRVVLGCSFAPRRTWFIDVQEMLVGWVQERVVCNIKFEWWRFIIPSEIIINGWC